VTVCLCNFHLSADRRTLSEQCLPSWHVHKHRHVRNGMLRLLHFRCDRSRPSSQVHLQCTDKARRGTDFAKTSRPTAPVHSIQSRRPATHCHPQSVSLSTMTHTARNLCNASQLDYRTAMAPVEAKPHSRCNMPDRHCTPHHTHSPTLSSHSKLVAPPAGGATEAQHRHSQCCQQLINS
jgi:hypothetical protein